MKEFLTPALVSTIVTAVLVPTFFYLLKRRDEMQKRNFEVRYAEYRKYMQTLEEITASTPLDFEKTFQQIVSDFFRSPMSDLNSANAALIKMQESLSPLMNKMRESFTRANNELHGLRLVCSDKLLKLVDEYVKLQEELLKSSGSLMEKWVDLGIQSSFQAKIPDEMTKMGLRSKQLFDEIVIQMRKELRIK